MPRVKITEYTAKHTLLSSYSGYQATQTTTQQELRNHFGTTNLVVKVDQGIKKRGLQELVKVNVTPTDIPGIIKEWAKKGWTNFLVEPVIEHGRDAEHYLALERTRAGWQISYSDQGGIDVEKSWNSVQRMILPPQGLTLADAPTPTNIFTGREAQTLKAFLLDLIPLLDKHHIAFLEMNPILIRGPELIPLDMAAEVDSVASTLPLLEDRLQGEAERAVARLDAATPASLKFRLINPQGRIWMLLSGGGASLVLADEVADQGMGTELANYGEYSGAPTDDDVYSYTKIILTQMLHRPSTIDHRPLALVIAAGIANFTDVARTFRGIIRALAEVKTELKKAKVKVFVRRGGPNEAKGLKMMTDFLVSAGIQHIIHTHITPITQVITEVKQYLVSPPPKGTALKRNSRLQAEKGSSADERTVPTGTNS